MPLPNTVIVQPDWVRAQNPAFWLTPDEMQTYAAWVSEKRKSEWLAGRLAAKKLLRDALGIAPLDWQIGRDGVAPVVVGQETAVTLSLSHSDGMGAATFSETRTEGSAGVDIQRIRPVHPGLCARVFTPGERQQIAVQFGSEDSADGMLLFWALKEAAIKARRQAWGRSLQAVEVHLSEENSSEVIIEGEPPLTAQFVRAGAWWLARVVKPPSEFP